MSDGIAHEMVDMWYPHLPVVIAPNNFVHKSLSNWSCNCAVGCVHGCRFCYVPDSSTKKLAPKLKECGVDDPDEQWGQYVLLRAWDEREFMNSLAQAERMPSTQLKPDGNRAVMFSSTTDPYQVIRHAEPSRYKELNKHYRSIVRHALELIRDHSSLNVRILTRSPLARRDFDLFASFGSRLLFGMSLPTLRNDLSRVYEPHAPAPTQRLATLQAAVRAGLRVFVAMAPTYPECDEADLRATLGAIGALNPVTIFHEPINIRAENVARIAEHARHLGVRLQLQVFEQDRWLRYALHQLETVERIAVELGHGRRVHLWPDDSLGSSRVLASLPHPDLYRGWLAHWWNRISEWPR